MVTKKGGISVNKHVSKLLPVSLALMLMLISALSCATAEGFDTNADFGLRQAEVAEGEPDYATALFSAELYNYKVLRNDPVAFESAGWNAYMAKAGLLESISSDSITDDDLKKIEYARKARSELIQIASAADTR